MQSHLVHLFNRKLSSGVKEISSCQGLTDGESMMTRGTVQWRLGSDRIILYSDCDDVLSVPVFRLRSKTPKIEINYTVQYLKK